MEHFMISNADATVFFLMLSYLAQWVTLSFRLDQVLNSVLDQSLNWTQKSGFIPMLRLTLVLD